MPEASLPRKISAPARIGNAYELRLFALSCLKMVSDTSIEHVRHEDSSAAPADDVIIEFKDRIECFQAKHAMNPNALLEIDFDAAELVDKVSDLHINLAELGKAWHSLQASGKKIIICIFTNRAAGAELSSLLECDHFKDEFIENTWQKRKRKKLQEKIGLSDEDLGPFLNSLRFDLRQPNEEGLDEVIRYDWLQRKFGLTSSGVYGRLLAHAERWYLEGRTRPIYRNEVLEALQIDNSSLPQRFPVDLKTYVARPGFEQEVLKSLFRGESTYTAIVGTPGSGKSTFITRFTDELRRKKQPIIRYYAFTQINDPLQRERVTAQAFLKSMIEQLHHEFPDLIPDQRRYEYSDSRLNELLTLLGNHFHLRGQQLLMIVDGIDHAGRAEIENTQKLLNVLPKQLPSGVVCLVGTQSTEYLPPVIERQCREALCSIPLFEIEQTRYFLNHYFDSETRPKEQTIDVIYRCSEGLPLYLHFIAERLSQVSIDKYDDLVEKLPPHGGHIDFYYSALWSEFSREPKLKKLCGVAARLRFRIQVSDLLRIAGITDTFEGEPLFKRMKHLMQVSDAGCRVFHNSFRDFIWTELSPDQLQHLDESILLSYLDGQRNQLLWFMYAHRYAETAKAHSYLMTHYEQNYISEAIRCGRPRSEIIEALKATARAAISERNLVITARTAALLSHTQERMEHYLDRAQLWRTLLSLGEINDALAAFAQEREVYDLSTETARIIVHLAERGEYEFGHALAQDFLEKLPRQIEGGDYAVAVGELISVYSARAATTLVQWIGEEPEPDSRLPHGRADLGTALLPKALKNLYAFKRWDVLRILRKLLPLQPGWEARRDQWLLEITKVETKYRPNTAYHYARYAEKHIKSENNRILLAGHVALNDLGQDIVESLLENIILHPPLNYEDSRTFRPEAFEIFFAYVTALLYIHRNDELKILRDYIHTSNSSIACLYQLNHEIATNPQKPEILLNVLSKLAKYEKPRGEANHSVFHLLLFSLHSLLKRLIFRYINAKENLNLLIEHLRYIAQSKVFRIPIHESLQILASFPQLRGQLEKLLIEVYDEIFNHEFETQSRTEKLLSISELACQCGHVNLGRAWLQTAVLALRGYGYRKDSTVGLLIEALEEVSSVQPAMLRQRVANIAEWNLLMPEVTEDGKGIRWFPISLYNTAMHFDLEIARELLLTYYEHVAEWKFSDVLTSFLRSYNSNSLILAYVLSELIHENGFNSEDNYKDKFEARLNLLKVAIEQKSQDAARWIERHIRQFLLTEVPPTERTFLVESFNKRSSDFNLLPINIFSTYPQPNKDSSSIDLEPPTHVELSGEQVLTTTLAQKLSQSLETFLSGFDQLLERYDTYRLRIPLKQAVEQIVHKVESISELEQIAHCLQKNNEMVKAGYGLLAEGYIRLGRPDKAAEYYKQAFTSKNEFELWNPQMDEFQRLAEINPNQAFNALFEFADSHLRDRSWGGEAIFLLFLKGALALGESYHQNAIELYEAFHVFVQGQFDHLPVISPSPYSWLRDPNYQVRSFEEIAQRLIEQVWSSPLLHCRQHLVHLLKDLALYQPNFTIPWLISLLIHEDYTLNTQSALVIASIALDRPNLLTDHIDQLIAALNIPHAERVYYLKQTLEAIANNFENSKSITEKLESLRPRIAGTSLIILPDTLRSTPYFQTQTLGRTTRSIRKAIERICQDLDFDLDKLHWQIEQEIEAMGFDREIAKQEFEKRGQTYCSRLNKDWIPFETYDDYYVWHAFNRVIERELRENVVNPSAQMAIDSLIRLYDPRFPLSNIESKPSDINVPFVHKGYTLTEEAQAWLNFEGEELWQEQPLENAWITVVDEYYQKAGRITEKRLSTSFLASHTLADTILRGDWRVTSGEAVLQLAPEPPYYSLTIDEAKSCLKRGQSPISNDPFTTISLVTMYGGDWWRYTDFMLASVAGEWIRRYEMSWNSPDSLNLSFHGKPAQKLISCRDGFEVGYGSRKLVGQGNRLLLSKDFLETLMQDYNLCLIVTSWTERSAYKKSIGKEHEVEFMKEQESLIVYRTIPHLQP